MKPHRKKRKGLLKWILDHDDGVHFNVEWKDGFNKSQILCTQIKNCTYVSREIEKTCVPGAGHVQFRITLALVALDL